MILVYMTQDGKATPIDHMMAEEIQIIKRDRAKLDNLTSRHKYGHAYSELKMKIEEAEDRVENYKRLIEEKDLTVGGKIVKMELADYSNKYEIL